MTDLQVVFAVGGAFGTLTGTLIGASLAAWLFRRPRRHSAAPRVPVASRRRLATPPRRTPQVRPAHPAGARRHRPADPQATAAMGPLDTTGAHREHLHR
jgi:hypothetical protein